jgi:hypothetical protein
MNEQMSIVVLPMIGVPLISLAAAWIQHSIAKFRTWMTVRIIEVFEKDLETSTNKVVALEKEMNELKKQVETELPWDNVLRTILPDTPTLE